jgi:hypothetical protein
MRKTSCFFLKKKGEAKSPSSILSNQRSTHTEGSPPKEKHFHASYLLRLHARPAKTLKEGEQIEPWRRTGRSKNPASQETIRHPRAASGAEASPHPPAPSTRGQTISTPRTTERSDEPMHAYGRWEMFVREI